MSKIMCCLVVVLEVGALLAPFCSAHAALGGGTDTIQNDSVQLKASTAVSTSGAPGESYTIHQIQAPSVAVKEFVSSSGVVFAITWQGARNPDLQTLLGSYYASYKSGRDSSRAGKKHPGQDRHHVMINTESLVVSRSGRAPRLKGLAYDPKLLPSGFDLGALQ